jgi:hypothetical protein
MKARVCAISCLVLACSSGTPAPRSKLAGEHEMEERAEAHAKTPADSAPVPDPEHAQRDAAASLLATVDELAELHRRHGKDCAALAAALETFHAAHGAALASTSAEVHAYIDAEPSLRERLRASMEAVMSASMACRDDPSFAAKQAQMFAQGDG